MANLFVVYTADARARANSESEKSSPKQNDILKNFNLINSLCKTNPLISKIFVKPESSNKAGEDKRMRIY
uniref:Uncharacterized protein n=1 Tax=Parastrongyloides trichosuri TaxID=131310 RepID=A0A0N4ZA25_PARTI